MQKVTVTRVTEPNYLQWVPVMSNINIDDSFTHSQQPGRNILEKTHDNAVIDSLT